MNNKYLFLLSIALLSIHNVSLGENSLNPLKYDCYDLYNSDIANIQYYIICAEEYINNVDGSISKIKRKIQKTTIKDNLYMKDLIHDITTEVKKRIDSHKIALQFVLEELDAAKEGDNAAKVFAKNSGFKEMEYKGAMSNSFKEVDGPNGPQQFLLLSVINIKDKDLKVKIRIAVVENVMQEWNLGKYKR